MQQLVAATEEITAGHVEIAQRDQVAGTVVRVLMMGRRDESKDRGKGRDSNINTKRR